MKSQRRLNQLTHITGFEEVFTCRAAHHEALAIIITAGEVDPTEIVLEGRVAIPVLREVRVYFSFKAILIMTYRTDIMKKHRGISQQLVYQSRCKSLYGKYRMRG